MPKSITPRTKPPNNIKANTVAVVLPIFLSAPPVIDSPIISPSCVNAVLVAGTVAEAFTYSGLGP